MTKRFTILIVKRLVIFGDFRYREIDRGHPRKRRFIQRDAHLHIFPSADPVFWLTVIQRGVGDAHDLLGGPDVPIVYRIFSERVLIDYLRIGMNDYPRQDIDPIDGMAFPLDRDILHLAVHHRTEWEIGGPVVGVCHYPFCSHNLVVPDRFLADLRCLVDTDRTAFKVDQRVSPIFVYPLGVRGELLGDPRYPFRLALGIKPELRHPMHAHVDTDTGVGAKRRDRVRDPLWLRPVHKLSASPGRLDKVDLA